MIYFNNDYNHTAHPAIFEAFAAIQDNAYDGYGLDTMSAQAAEDIKKYLDNPDSEVHFLAGGTQTNMVFITSVLRPWQSALSSDVGHIERHETGAIEHNGHKVEVIPSVEGKITAEQVDDYLSQFDGAEGLEHVTVPGVLYLTSPTEYGTVYNKAELTAISEASHKHGVPVYLDGARLAYAFGCDEFDVTLADLARLTDAFYIGGNKCGTMMGEALVINNKELQTCFRSVIKQNGAIVEKGWVLGLQFHTLFKDGLYFELGKEVIDMAMAIKAAFKEKGIPFYVDSPTNQQFVILTKEQVDKFTDKFVIEYDGRAGDDYVIRFCTSWSTKWEEVEELIETIKAL